MRLFKLLLKLLGAKRLRIMLGRRFWFMLDDGGA